jgi:carbon-monoxide dehydrogenase medium subunit
VRVCVGAASATPVRLEEVERSACGQPLDAEAAERLGDAYATAITPISDVRGSAWYRREMIRVLVSRALIRCGSSERETYEL